MIDTNTYSSFFIADQENDSIDPITKQIFDIGNSSNAGNDSSFERRNSFSSLDSSSSSSNSFAASQNPSDASIVKGKINFLHCSEINDKDILCGRDKVSFSHSGNKIFRAIIDKHRKQYQCSTLKEDKTKIIVRIVTMIKESNGRFLKRTSSKSLDSISPNTSDLLTSSSYWYPVKKSLTEEQNQHFRHLYA